MIAEFGGKGGPLHLERTVSENIKAKAIPTGEDSRVSWV